MEEPEEQTLELRLERTQEGVSYVIVPNDRIRGIALVQEARDFGRLVHAVVYFTRLGRERRWTYDLKCEDEAFHALGLENLGVLDEIFGIHNSMIGGYRKIRRRK